MSTDQEIEAAGTATDPAPRLPKLLSVKREKTMPLNQVLLTFEDTVEAWSVFQWVKAGEVRTSPEHDQK
ncbi:hypothetical protein [Paraburkholderia sediminicola]|uniref:hypothetical protein n=1 Tax=Paraburkholderia sediminicola TaxID=458836 RepID=UPI0038B75B3A